MDVRSAALGEPLPPGLWEVDVQLVGVLGEVPAPVTVAWTECARAIVGPTLVVVSPTVTPTLQIDVGPTTWPFVTGADPAQATITESAAGSLMVLPLQHVYVQGSQTIGGQIALDSLRLRADIITDGYAARLESFVSGLFGSPHLSAAFGETPMKPTGLGLDIDGLGGIVVSKAKPKKPAAAAAKAPAKKAPAKKAAAKKPGTPKPAAKKTAAKKTAAKKKPVPAAPPRPAQQLRRALPKSLDPMVKRVAKNPLARELYQKAIKR